MTKFHEKYNWLIFIALSLSVMMVDVDMTAVNIAINTMATSLSISLATAQWIVDGYTIAAASLIAFGGRCAPALVAEPAVHRRRLVADLVRGDFR